MIYDLVRINDIKSTKKYSLVGGPFGSDLSGKHYVDIGVPVIRGGNLPFGKKFDCSDFVFVSEKKANKLKSNTAFPGDIVFTQRGTLGQVGIVPSDYDRYIVSQSQMKLTVDESKAVPLYVYYYFRTKECVKRIENIALSSGVPHTNLGILQNFKIPLPPLTTQKKIASIFSAYDDLIENNNQRIQVLEEMAEEIYKEWFVRFRFPGYENAKFFDKEGKEVDYRSKDAVPEGWQKKPIKDIVNNIKKKFKEEEHSDLGIFDLSRMPRKSLSIPEFGASDELESSRIIFNENDILFGSIRSYFHKGSSANKRGITNVSVLIFRPKKEIYRSYALFTFFSSQFINWSVNFSNGTKMPTISWNEVQNYSVYKPIDNLLKSFEKIVFPMIKEIHVLSDKNQLLQETRDLLLPRLISGKLSVEDLEIEGLNMSAEPSIKY